MWNECAVGNFNLVTNALAREYQRSEVLQQCQGVDQSGDDDMLDDDSEDNNDNNNNTEEDNTTNQHSHMDTIEEELCVGQVAPASEGQEGEAHAGEWEQVRRSGRVKNRASSGHQNRMHIGY